MNEVKKLEKIGEILKFLRKKAGYTSYESFAWEHGLQRQTVYRAEKGENITLQTLMIILGALGVSLEEFFKGMK